MEQQKKVVLITGCSSGIGRALAEEFFENGYIVYATARKIETLEPLKQKGLLVETVDVTNSESIQEINNRITKEQGRLDVLVNNAGYATISPLVELGMPELRKQFETNVFAPIQLIQIFLPLLLKSESAQIVNIGSVSAILSTPFAGAYCASKAALHLLSDALRMELAPFNIEVITIQTGAIRSQFGQRATSEVDQNQKSDSLYTKIREGIYLRAQASQDKPTPADIYAKKVVAHLQKSKPASIVRLGRGSLLLMLMKRLISENLLDGILSKKFKLSQLKPE